MLEDIDAETEDRPDECIELPDNKVKLVIGAGGENIKRIQKKSNCRLQVRKKSKDMSIGFGGTDQGGLMRERGGADAAQPRNRMTSRASRCSCSSATPTRAPSPSA